MVYIFKVKVFIKVNDAENQTLIAGISGSQLSGVEVDLPHHILACKDIRYRSMLFRTALYAY